MGVNVTTNSTQTYTPIATQTASGSVSTITFGVGGTIPQNYTDLQLICNFGGSSTGANVKLNLGNGSLDTGNNYSNTRMSGDGGSAYSGTNSNFSFARLNTVMGDGDGSNINCICNVYLLNYSNTNTYKTTLSQIGQSNGTYPGTESHINLWRNTNAINIISVSVDAGNFLSGSTFTLYGILAA